MDRKLAQSFSFFLFIWSFSFLWFDQEQGKSSKLKTPAYAEAPEGHRC
jgi:hypothetical protein